MCRKTSFPSRCYVCVCARFLLFFPIPDLDVDDRRQYEKRANVTKSFSKTRTQLQIQFWQENSKVCSTFLYTCFLQCTAFRPFHIILIFGLFTFGRLNSLPANRQKIIRQSTSSASSLLTEIRTDTIKWRISLDLANFHAV